MCEETERKRNTGSRLGTGVKIYLWSVGIITAVVIIAATGVLD